MTDVRWRVAFCAWAVSVLFPAFIETARADVPIRQRLQEVHDQRQQVSYAFGGCDEWRMDCSCFVQTTFADEFGVALPRSTLSQVRYLQRSLISGFGNVANLRPEALCPGDLIYTYRGDSWRTSSRHVAISLGNGEILHAARGVGVSIQPLRVLGHHRLRGVVRLFDCRAGASTPPPRSQDLAQDVPDRTRSEENLQRLRGLIHEVFVAWEDRDRQALDRLWASSAMQWRTSSGSGGFSEPTDWSRSLRQLGGRKWRYWVHRLDVRGQVAFVEVASELLCTGSSRSECGRMDQTFIWHREADGRWRIGQHEIGAAQ